MTMVVCTGHRPPGLGGFSAKKKLKEIKKCGQKKLIELKPSIVITGMAIGWDTMIAEICVDEGISFIAALPFEGQDIRWPPRIREHYHWLLSKAAKTVYIDREQEYVSLLAAPGVYHTTKMQRRNEWMIDQMQKGDILLACWDNVARGGTYNCIQYWRECSPYGSAANTRLIHINPNTFDDLPF